MNTVSSREQASDGLAQSVRGRVTVVTVCLNAANHIVDCVKSVADQTYHDIEHIVIDGGSRDATVDLARANARPGAVVLSGPDDGLYDAMNKGIALASGEFIALLNADDRYNGPDVIERVVGAFRTEDCDAVIGDVEFFAADEPTRVVRRYDSGRFRPERIGFGVMPAHPATILTAEAYSRVGFYDKSYSIAADYDFIARAFVTHRLSYTYLPEVFVRMTAGGLSNRSFRSAQTISREMLAACRKHGISTNRWKIWSRIPAKILEKLPLARKSQKRM